MIANYHTHTERCRHAGNHKDREYVEAALTAGMQTLGFADHTPQIFRNGYTSTFRMDPEQLADYVRSIAGLKEEYRGRIQVLTGLETEYYPDHFRDLLALLREHPVDYLILGQHFIHNEYDAPDGGICTDRKDVVRRYCEQCVEAMHTGVFSCFAHPDIMCYHGDKQYYQDAVRPMCREARRLGIPLEINLEGIRRNKHYPNMAFWEIAAQEACTAVLGSDAHRPADVHSPEAEKKARAMARYLGLKLLDKLELRPVRR